MYHKAFKKYIYKGRNSTHGGKDFIKSINDEDKLNRPNSWANSQWKRDHTIIYLKTSKRLERAEPNPHVCRAARPRPPTPE